MQNSESWDQSGLKFLSGYEALEREREGGREKAHRDCGIKRTSSSRQWNYLLIDFPVST